MTGDNALPPEAPTPPEDLPDTLVDTLATADADQLRTVAEYARDLADWQETTAESDPDTEADSRTTEKCDGRGMRGVGPSHRATRCGPRRRENPTIETNFGILTHIYALGEDRPALPDAPADVRTNRVRDGMRLEIKPPHGAPERKPQSSGPPSHGNALWRDGSSRLHQHLDGGFLMTAELTDAEGDAPTYNHGLGDDRLAIAANGSNADDAPADPRMATECDNQRKPPPCRATASGSSGRVYAHTEIPCCILVAAGAPGVGRSPVYSASVTDATADAPTRTHALGDDRPAIPDDTPADVHTNRKCDGRRGVRLPHGAPERKPQWSGPPSHGNGLWHDGGSRLTRHSGGGFLMTAELTDAEVDALTANHDPGDDRPAIAADGSNADDAPADPQMNRECGGGRLGVKPPHRATESGPIGVGHVHTETRCGSVARAGLSRVEDRPAIPDDAPADVHTNRKCGGRKGPRPPHRARDHSPVGVAHGHRKTRYGAMVAADSPGTRVVVS